MATKELKGAEIFASGTWNDLSFTTDDLDGIVSSFLALNLGGRVPLKLGHEGPDVRDDPATQFAMGWVQRVWRDGRKLMADLEVPEAVSTMIEDGMLKFVSVELLRNVQASNTEIPWVLDAVALLGSDPPAVGILKDLKALSFARDFEFRDRQCFSRASYQPFTGDTNKMSDGNKPVTLESLQALMMEQGQKILELQTENRALKGKQSEGEQFKARFDRLVEENKQRDIKDKRAAIKAQLEAAVKDDKILPAARERFCKVYKVDEDETVMAITAEDVAEFIRENPNPLPKKKPRTTPFSLNSSADDVPPGTPPDQELTLRVFARLKEQGKHEPTHTDIVRVGQEILRTNPELADNYRYQPDKARA